MSSPKTPLPVIPNPPGDYNVRFMSDLARAFSVLTDHIRNPGEEVVATLTILNCPEYADNSAAVAGGLGVGDVYKTAGGDLRIVV